MKLHNSGLSTTHSAELLAAPETVWVVLNDSAVFVFVIVAVKPLEEYVTLAVIGLPGLAVTPLIVTDPAG